MHRGLVRGVQSTLPLSPPHITQSIPVKFICPSELSNGSQLRNRVRAGHARSAPIRLTTFQLSTVVPIRIFGSHGPAQRLARSGWGGAGLCHGVDGDRRPSDDPRSAARLPGRPCSCTGLPLQDRWRRADDLLVHHRTQSGRDHLWARPIRSHEPALRVLTIDRRNGGWRHGGQGCPPVPTR
jgi:hypothetical protein